MFKGMVLATMIMTAPVQTNQYTTVKVDAANNTKTEYTWETSGTVLDHGDYLISIKDTYYNVSGYSGEF